MFDLGRHLAAGVAGCLLLLFAAPATAATVVVAVPHWPSAQVTANIIGAVLRAHYGVTVRLRPMGTREVFDAIDRGEVDVHPEVWLPNTAEAVAEYAERRGTLRLSPRHVPAMQRLCTTRHTAEATGLTSARDLADPAIAARFDTDADGKGEIWIGAFTWSSTPVERVRARSYGYDATMTLLTMPEDMAMAALDAAVALDAPFVFYCYAPHHMFALHDLVILDEPVHDPATWTIVRAEDDPAWLSKSRAGSAWEPSRFQIGYASALARDRADIAAFLDNIALTAQEAEAMSYAVNVERRDPQEVADAFVADNAARIEEWTR